MMADPLLFDGQRLDQPTFHALYVQTPERFRAELIDGVVHLRNERVRAAHGQPHSTLIALLCLYSIDTPGTKALGRVTMILGPRSEVEPDTTLLIHPDFGGKMRTDPGGMLVGSPELVVEIADETLEVDLNVKKRDYQRAGAGEYLVLEVIHRTIRWFLQRAGRFELLSLDEDGLFRSPSFPGLWLDPGAILRDDSRAIMSGLRRGLESPEHAAFVEQLRTNRANRP